MRWKVSKYTRLFNLSEGSLLLFNGLSGATINIHKTEASKIKNVFKNNNLNSGFIPGNKIWPHLQAGHFVVQSLIDEYKYIKKRFAVSRSNARFLLTIFPTLKCNLKCSYCFVSKKNISMSEELQKSCIDFVSNRFNSKDFNGITVDWLGGEPLLVIPIIKRLSKGFINISEKKGVPYSAQVITNGTLLNNYSSKQLLESGVDRLQITIDGNKSIHDLRRYNSIKGTSSFDKIITGLNSSIGRFLIRLRINVDQNNLEQVWPLLDFFKKEGWLGPNTNFFPYLARIAPLTNECFNCNKSISSMSDFLELQIKWIESLAKLNVPVLFQELYNFPSPRLYNCAAIGNAGIVIMPDGNIHKCGLTINNPEEAITCLSDSQRINSVNIKKWAGYSPFRFKKCRSCQYLPTCLSGCPRDQLFSRSEAKKDTCEFHQSWEDKMIILHAELAYKNRVS